MNHSTIYHLEEFSSHLQLKCFEISKVNFTPTYKHLEHKHAHDYFQKKQIKYILLV